MILTEVGSYSQDSLIELPEPAEDLWRWFFLNGSQSKSHFCRQNLCLLSRASSEAGGKCPIQLTAGTHLTNAEGYI